MSAAATGQDPTPAIVTAAPEVEWAACACCGLTEECTPAYAAGVRARYGGRWLCGLCGEAVDEELAGGREVDEAFARHAAFCRAFQSPVAAERLIAAVRRLLRSSGAGEKEKVVVVGFEEA